MQRPHQTSQTLSSFSGGQRSTYLAGILACVVFVILFASGCNSSSSQDAVEARVESGTRIRVPWGLFSYSVLDEQPLANNRINDLAIGDIDGDGHLDIWVSGRNGTDHQSAWYKNPGNTSASWQRYTYMAGSWKYGDLGDLDGDGDLDIVSGFDDENRIYWVENDGTPVDGGWAKHDMGLDGKPDLFYVKDLDGNGQNEAVAIYKGDTAVIMRRPSDPTNGWDQTVVKTSEGGYAGGTLGDIDSDGDQDLVYGNKWLVNPGATWTDGATWAEQVIDSSWPKVARSVVADIDGDEDNDVVLSGEESKAGIAWYENDGTPEDGGWTKHVVNSVPYEGVHSLQIADFDQDGDQDIFAAEMHTTTERRVTVFQQEDADTWTENVIATTGSHNARVADLNGDGYPDIAGKNFEAGDLPLRVETWMSENAEAVAGFPLDRWQRHVLDSEAQNQALFVEPRFDVDGDGNPDIVTGKYWYENPGQASGTWRRHVITADLENMAVVADFDRDGDVDVLGTTGTLNSDEFVWAENDGRGSFESHSNIASAEGDFLQGARLAQMVTGGPPEILLSWHNRTSTQMLRVSEPPERGTWAHEVLSDTTNGEQVAVSDIDGDGDQDIHLGTQWLRQEEDGEWTAFAAVSMGDGEADPDRVELVDVDGDGDRDVVIGCEHARRLVWGERPLDPTQPWTEHVIDTDYLYMSLDVGDLDGDGDADVVAGAHRESGQAFVFENAGEGAWTRHTIDRGDNPDLDHHVGMQLVDVEGDGDLDVVSIGWTSQKLILYENRAIVSTHAFQ